MAKSNRSRKHTTSRSKGERAPQTTDWLAFIRPHLEEYRSRGWGKQKEFIDDLADKTGRNANTLRRYIAAAELLEAYGVTEFPAGLKKLPVASVEAIGRISKKDFAEGRRLLNDLMSGSGTIRGLKKQLAGLTKRKKPRRMDSTVAMSSIKQVNEEIEAFVAGNEDRRDWLPAEIHWFPYADWAGPQILARAAWPKIFVPLIGGHNVVVFDEAELAWITSPATVTRDFIRNIAAATSMFDFVLVYCAALQPDVERAVAAMLPDSRDRVVVRQGTLDLARA